MEYNKENYVGRKIWLFPNDTYSKKGVIKDVDDLGFTILITEADEMSGYAVGRTYFFNRLEVHKLYSSCWSINKVNNIVRR